MTKFLRWLKKWWWTLLIGAGAIAGFLFGLSLRKSDDAEHPPDFVEKAKAKKEIIDAQAAVEKIKVKAKADEERARLDEIGKINDVRERRTRLAEFMKGL
jgi:hypothetical protein